MIASIFHGMHAGYPRLPQLQQMALPHPRPQDPDCDGGLSDSPKILVFETAEARNPRERVCGSCILSSAAKMHQQSTAWGLRGLQSDCSAAAK
jgi:hypothetical protein